MGGLNWHGGAQRQEFALAGCHQGGCMQLYAACCLAASLAGCLLGCLLCSLAACLAATAWLPGCLLGCLAAILVRAHPNESPERTITTPF